MLCCGAQCNLWQGHVAAGATSAPQCWYGYRCRDGTMCNRRHTPDQMAFFRRFDGACPRNYKTALCNRGDQCYHVANTDRCAYAHGEQDFLCTICWQTGHIARTCNSIGDDALYQAVKRNLAETNVRRPIAVAVSCGGSVRLSPGGRVPGEPPRVASPSFMPARTNLAPIPS